MSEELSDNEILKWLESGKHLPEMMRDFHDQKDLFKVMHGIYENKDNESDVHPNMPNWTSGHVYTVDWFLWYMAGRGYTLQKSRKDLQFWPFEDKRETLMKMISVSKADS